MRARKQPSQQRSRALVDAILEGTARVLDRSGPGATTNHIAREAGVSVGSLYQYFPNKQALLLALAERHLDRGTAALRRAAAENRGAASIRDFVRALVSAIVAEHRTHPRTQAQLREFAPQSAALMSRFKQLQEEVAGEIAAQLRRLRPDVDAPLARARLAVHAIDGALHGTIASAEPGSDYVEEIVRLGAAYLEASGG